MQQSILPLALAGCQQELDAKFVRAFASVTALFAQPDCNGPAEWESTWQLRNGLVHVGLVNICVCSGGGDGGGFPAQVEAAAPAAMQLVAEAEGCR